MTKTELLNKTAQDPAQRLLLAKALDKLELTRARSIPSHTGFLSPEERGALEGLIAASGHARHFFFGGYEGAERTLCVFLPDWQEEEDFLTSDAPVSLLRASFHESGTLSHRDFLGSVLGLGVTREKVGDLLVSGHQCDLLIVRELEEFLLQHLERAGRTALKLTALPLTSLAPPEVQTKLIRDTVATLRLDAVMAGGFSLSRGKAADLISAGRVQLNHRDCVKPDRTVARGDVISCRGLGKCVVTETGGLSKKGRIMIVLERYL